MAKKRNRKLKQENANLKNNSQKISKKKKKKQSGKNLEHIRHRMNILKPLKLIERTTNLRWVLHQKGIK